MPHACGLLTPPTTWPPKVEVGPDGVKPVPGSEKHWPCDLVILAMGFVSPEQEIIQSLNVDVDQRNNVHAE